MAYLNRITSFWLVITAVVFAGSAAAEVAHLAELREVDQAAFQSGTGELIAAEDTVAALYVVSLALTLLTAGFFLAWLRRAYRNITALGVHRLRFGPGWAIGGWLVPVLWWWRPKQILNDVWRTGDPSLPARPAGGAWQQREVPHWHSAWWILFCALPLAYLTLSAELAYDFDTDVHEARTDALLTAVDNGIQAVLALVAVVVVRASTRRLERRARALAALDPAPVFAVAPERPDGA